MLTSKSRPRSKRRNGRNPIAVNIAAELACQLIPAITINHLSSHIILGISVSVLVYYPMIFFLSPTILPDLHCHPIMLGIFWPKRFVNKNSFFPLPPHETQANPPNKY